MQNFRGVFAKRDVD